MSQTGKKNPSPFFSFCVKLLGNKWFSFFIFCAGTLLLAYLADNISYYFLMNDCCIPTSQPGKLVFDVTTGALLLSELAGVVALYRPSGKNTLRFISYQLLLLLVGLAGFVWLMV